MSSALEGDLASRVRELRDAFDGSFAAPRVSSAAPAAHLLLIGVGGQRYGLRIDELQGLHPDCSITPLPSPDPALLGIAGIRGCLVPAYSLAALLDAPDQRGAQRWLAVCNGSEVPVALAFEDFAGSIRASESDLFVPAAGEQLPAHTVQVARLRRESCYVISTRSILKTISHRTAAGETSVVNGRNFTAGR